MSFVPLGKDACARSATQAARDFSAALNADESVALPVYYYGLVSASQRRLQDIRRAFGYFEQPMSEMAAVAGLGDLVGRRAASLQAASALTPDEGSIATYTSRRGIMTLGVVPELVRNLNFRFRCRLVAAHGDRGAAEAQCRRALSAAVTKHTRIAGLVEALTLPYGSRDVDDETIAVEVACNLLRPRQHSEERVEAAVRTLFDRFVSECDGARTGRWRLTDVYTTGPDEGSLLDLLAARVHR